MFSIIKGRTAALAVNVNDKWSSSNWQNVLWIYLSFVFPLFALASNLLCIQVFCPFIPKTFTGQERF